jgi:hypothetical protein
VRALIRIKRPVSGAPGLMRAMRLQHDVLQRAISEEIDALFCDDRRSPFARHSSPFTGRVTVWPHFSH